MLQTFAEHAPVMRAAGWAVLPANGKAPIRTGFNRWKGAPSLNTVNSWAEREPGADIVFIPGLSITGKGRRGVIVVDADDANAIDDAERLFGPTPGRVQTRRGEHRLFNGAGIDLGTITSLRAHGLNIDLKHGQAGAGISVAPPSKHENDPAFRYKWAECDETVIRHLPRFPAAKLEALLGKTKPAQAPECGKKTFRCDSRGLALNDFLVGQAWAFDDLNTALDVARTWNEQLPRLGHEPLDDKEVIERTRAVFEDLQEGKIERRAGMRATCTSDADEIRLLATLSGNGDAFMLLLLLRAEHSARCRRGEPFAINPDAMERKRSLGTWSAKKYRAARDVLLTAGFIQIIKTGSCGRGGRVSTLYTLAPRTLTPSVTVRREKTA